ncbi:MAG: hypothetical protein IKG67_11275 [Parasporobacterium sp.]|nr:hypothetical protein [Parasporobacterium sp.]
MRFLYEIKNRIDDYYQKHPTLSGLIIKFVLSIVVLFLLRANIGFNPILSNVFFVILFAAVCSFVPIKLMTMALVAYAIVQIFSLSTGLGVLACILFVIMYLIYFRFDERTGYAIVLVPLFCIIRLPFLVPAVLAVTAGVGSVISSLLGLLFYYFIHYMQMNTAVFMGAADNTELTKISMALSGLFSYREMWYTMACVLIAFFAVYYLKKININKSSYMAVSIGTGIYLILILVSNLLCESMTYNKLFWIVFGSVLTCILAIVISDLLLPLDYSRTELLEFEDEEYKYFVRAVPKVSVSKKSVKIKRIYARKRSVPRKEKEEKG